VRGFAEGIARRAAGLVPQAGRHLLQLRARSRFDQGSLSSPGAELTSGDGTAPASAQSVQETVIVPSQHGTADTGPFTLGRQSRAETPHEALRAHDAIEATSPCPETRERVPPLVAPQIAPPAVVQRDGSERADTRQDTPSTNDLETPVTTQQVTLRPESTDADPLNNAGAALAPAVHRSAPARVPAQPATGDAPPRQDEKPSVTITIGRIAIDFGSEVPATAPAPVREVQRTRGFENYADARRGRSR
jgi:hypothetical protein